MKTIIALLFIAGALALTCTEGTQITSTISGKEECVACTSVCSPGTCSGNVCTLTSGNCKPGFFESTNGNGGTTCSACAITGCKTCPTSSSCSACADGFEEEKGDGEAIKKCNSFGGYLFSGIAVLLALLSLI